jgi:hypothetical protein
MRIILTLTLLGALIGQVLAQQVYTEHFKITDDYCAKVVNWMDTNCIKEFNSVSNRAVQLCDLTVAYARQLNAETNGVDGDMIWKGM